MEAIDPELGASRTPLVAAAPICEAMYIAAKAERQDRFAQILQEAIETVAGDDADRKAKVKKSVCRFRIFRGPENDPGKKERADGRGLSDIRPITSE